MDITDKYIILDVDDMMKIVGKIRQEAQEKQKRKELPDTILFYYLPPHQPFLGMYLHMGYKLVPIEEKPEPYY